MMCLKHLIFDKRALHDIWRASLDVSACFADSETVHLSLASGRPSRTERRPCSIKEVLGFGPDLLMVSGLQKISDDCVGEPTTIDSMLPRKPARRECPIEGFASSTTA